MNDVNTEIAAVRGQVEQFAALNAPCIVYAECSNTVQGNIAVPVSGRPRFAAADVRAYGAKLSDLAKWMADQGVTLAYHHHMGSFIESEDDVNALMEGSTPEVKLLFDTGHLAFGGADVMRVLNTWGARVHHVHFKDIRPEVVSDVRAHNRSFLDAVIAGAFTVPGDGCIDFQAVADKLKAMDYRGWIVVEAEQDPAKAPPYAYSKLGYDHILQVCAKADLVIDRSRPG